jgi:hypothetical protein
MLLSLNQNLLPCLYSGEISEKARITKIRKEYNRLERATLHEIIFLKNENHKWIRDSGYDEIRDSERYEEAKLNFDSNGNIRKLTINKFDMPVSYKRSEYFWPNGKLFFVYAKEVQGGSGDWWNARLYFWNGKIFKNLAGTSYHGHKGGTHIIINGRYKSPQRLGYYLKAEEVLRAFDLNMKKIESIIHSLIQKNRELKRTQLWLQSKGIHYNIASLEELWKLDLARIEVDDGELYHLKLLKKLQWLNLRGTCIADDGTALKKKRTRITDAGLVYISKLKNLRNLYLNDTKISDSGLIYLRDLKKLVELDLSNTNVTDKGLDHLKGLKNLKNLTLYGTKVTRDGMKRLKKLLPNCEIYLIGA